MGAKFTAVELDDLPGGAAIRYELANVHISTVHAPTAGVSVWAIGCA